MIKVKSYRRAGRVVKSHSRQAKLGSGQRFKKLSSEIASQYKSKGFSTEEAARIGAATAAKIGRKKYGAKKFSKLSKAGK